MLKMMDCDGNYRRWLEGIDRVIFLYVNIFIDIYSIVYIDIFIIDNRWISCKVVDMRC